MSSGVTIPRAVYRLQFHRRFTLRDAAALVPYLHALGVSHVYASPLLCARPDSPHGYDVCDPSRLNPELGDEAELEALVAALRERGLGLVLDIVPNHLAAAAENPWWWDVLKHGRLSRFAGYFDIDWDSPDPWLHGKVLLPVLRDEYERVLDRGELAVAEENAELTVRYGSRRFPLCPDSVRLSGAFVDESRSASRAGREALDRILGLQHYRLACGRDADRKLNYRRFFAIPDLAGVRVELPQVFADTHNCILAWQQRGLLDGLRVDHPDGLRDPWDYLRRLHRATPGAWVVVEKILEPGEELPAEWPVAGTTGYDFLHRAIGLFVDPAGERALTELFATFTGESTDYPEQVRSAKRQVLRQNLAAEVSRLLRLLADLVARHAPECDAGPEEQRSALLEVIAAFPVYRTYIRAEQGFLSPTDRSRISEAVAAARGGSPPPSPGVLTVLSDVLQLRHRGAPESEFVMRFQQLTGPAMAKGVEDTVFYRYNRLVALNEVGSDPARFGLRVGDFHQACGQARQHWPGALLATSTHDTKRSEDVRARLALLSEIPERWADAVRRWSALNEGRRAGGWPDRNAEYLFYQTLVGAWPLAAERAAAYLEKAAREAKQHTNWGEGNAAYEAALRDFVTGALGDPAFVEELERFVKPLVRAGYVNSLAQTLLKLTAPGVPDLYQGTECWELSLVDPDNRRPVDFPARREALAALEDRFRIAGARTLVDELLRDPADGRLKLWVIRQTLQFRRAHARLFRDGSYVSLPAAGSRAGHVCAFARTLDRTTVLTAVPRLILGLAGEREALPVSPDLWGDTRLVLPRRQTGRSFRNVLTDDLVSTTIEGTHAVLRLSEVLGGCPVALLENVGRPGRAALSGARET